VHVEHASGAKASRPQLDLVLQLLRAGDTLVITRLDRLGRSVLHLVTLGAGLRERRVGLQVLERISLSSGSADAGVVRPGAPVGTDPGRCRTGRSYSGP
jgi:DNA invertase Pin-like site-specific DNA recombinase